MTAQRTPQSPLSQAQRDELRRALETKRTQLLGNLRSRTETPEQLADAGEREPGDAADLAEVSLEDSDCRLLSERDRDLLVEIDRALERWKRGTFGLSEESGRPISFERLRAVPWTRYEADEAERIEKADRS